MTRRRCLAHALIKWGWAIPHLHSFSGVNGAVLISEVSELTPYILGHIKKIESKCIPLGLEVGGGLCTQCWLFTTFYYGFLGQNFHLMDLLRNQYGSGSKKIFHSCGKTLSALACRLWTVPDAEVSCALLPTLLKLWDLSVFPFLPPAFPPSHPPTLLFLKEKGKKHKIPQAEVFLAIDNSTNKKEKAHQQWNSAVPRLTGNLGRLFPCAMQAQGRSGDCHRQRDADR